MFNAGLALFTLQFGAMPGTRQRHRFNGASVLSQTNAKIQAGPDKLPLHQRVVQVGKSEPKGRNWEDLLLGLRAPRAMTRETYAQKDAKRRRAAGWQTLEFDVQVLLVAWGMGHDECYGAWGMMNIGWICQPPGAWGIGMGHGSFWLCLNAMGHGA